MHMHYTKTNDVIVVILNNVHILGGNNLKVSCLEPIWILENAPTYCQEYMQVHFSNPPTYQYQEYMKSFMAKRVKRHFWHFKSKSTIL